MENINKNIGERIRQKREMKNFSQDDMAIKLNLSDSAYGKLERGETKFDIDRLKQIANILGTSIAELIDSAIFYDVKNGNHSHIALHNSNVQVNDEEQSKSIQKLVELVPALIEKQNQLMDRMITIMGK